MKYFFMSGDGQPVLLQKFTATLPQEEIRMQTYIDRTDEYATGRILPGTFSWDCSPGEPQVAAGETFQVVDEDCTLLRCQVVTPPPLCTGKVLESREPDASQREKLELLIAKTK